MCTLQITFTNEKSELYPFASFGITKQTYQSFPEGEYVESDLSQIPEKMIESVFSVVLKCLQDVDSNFTSTSFRTGVFIESSGISNARSTIVYINANPDPSKFKMINISCLEEIAFEPSSHNNQQSILLIFSQKSPLE